METKGRKRYRVRLSAEERAELSGIVNGKAAAHRRKHAHILLLADEDREDGGRTDADIASVLGVGGSTVERVRKRCVEEGLEAAVERRTQVNRKPRNLDGAGEAKLVALACSAPPEGHARWTLRLLGDKLVELEVVDRIHKETVRKALEKNNLKPWRKQCWCIPPKANAEFVCAMENVLEVYHREFDEDTVLVCMDETSKQQTKETRTPRPVRPGQPAIVDFEYERNGVANLFIVFAPLLGWRWVKVTDRRTRHDWAHLIRELVDDIFPGKKIVLVMDNLNIHSLASLFWILGYRFSPRLADIGGARFWRIDRNADYDAFDRLARNQIDTELIAAAWPDLLRLAGSLKLGRVKADAVMRILQVKERPTPFARAIAELGRIVKTIHVLDYVNDAEKRRRILVQFNRQEYRHRLARRVCHGRPGELIAGYREGQEEKLGALGLMLNVIAFWNATYMQAVVENLQAHGR